MPWLPYPFVLQTQTLALAIGAEDCPDEPGRNVHPSRHFAKADNLIFRQTEYHF